MPYLYDDYSRGYTETDLRRREYARRKHVPPKAYGPMLPAMSAGEVRTHLRISDTRELSLIRSYILAAQDDIEIQCERALVTRRYRMTMSCFPAGRCPLPLTMCPVRRVESVTYFDSTNVSRDYADFVLLSDEEPGMLYPKLDEWWPVTYSRPDAITIDFWAGQVAPVTWSESAASGSGDPTDYFTSTSGFEFNNDDEVVISASGNANGLLGDTAALPEGLKESTTYFVVNSTGTTFRVASTVGGTAIALQAPTAGCQAIDLLFAGVLEPWQRLALLQMASKAFGQRCPQGGCVCTADDYESDPVLRRLKWRSPVEFV